MSTYLDTLDQDKVEAALVKFRASGQATTYLEYASGDERFALWLVMLDRRMTAMVGLGHRDLADFPSYDCYDAGMTPRDAALECREGDDAFSSMVGAFDE